MSAYVVENRTINRVLTFLDSSNEWRYLLNGALGALGYPDSASLGKAMLDLNCESVRQRYGECTEDSSGYSYDYESCDVFQALKSLRCWLYQSCEGDCDRRPLFVRMEDISKEMSYYIVSRLPQYDAAHWG